MEGGKRGLRSTCSHKGAIEDKDRGAVVEFDSMGVTKFSTGASSSKAPLTGAAGKKLAELEEKDKNKTEAIKRFFNPRSKR